MNWDKVCPECRSEDIEEGFLEEIPDGQGYAWTIRKPFSCNACGCEWNVNEETQVKLEIEKHGKEWEKEN